MGLLARGFLCSACCAFALGLPIHILAQEQKTAPADHQQDETIVGNSLSASLTSRKLPDSPGAEWTKLQSDSFQQESSSQPATQTARQPQAPATQDQKLQHPVGTAAAEAPKVSGITAAQPAGVAIAPAKQRRVRTIVLKVGAIIGAGAALGAVIALSEATPSKPPGAH
jgi:hypothetical protein